MHPAAHLRAVLLLIFRLLVINLILIIAVLEARASSA